MAAGGEALGDAQPWDVPDPVSAALGIVGLSTAAVYGGRNLEGRSNETAFKRGRNNICLHQAAEETAVQFPWGTGPCE